MIAGLIFQGTVEDLVDYWKLNTNFLDWAKKVSNQNYETIRKAFAVKKATLLANTENDNGR